MKKVIMPAMLALFLGIAVESQAQQGTSTNSLPGTNTGGGQGTQSTTPQPGTLDNSRQDNRLDSAANASGQVGTMQDKTARREKNNMDRDQKKRDKEMRRSKRMKSDSTSN